MKYIYDGVIECDNVQAKNDVIAGLTNADFVVWCLKIICDNTEKYKVYYISRKNLFERVV